jgi:hypothetical protein
VSSRTLAQLTVLAPRCEDASLEKVLDLPGAKHVSRDADGRLWIVGSHGSSREIDPVAPIGLLPIFECDPSAIPTEILDTLPIEQVLLLALERGSDYWPRLAVEWLAATGLTPALKPALEEFAHSQRGSQNTRHRARRLLRAGR